MANSSCSNDKNSIGAGAVKIIQTTFLQDSECGYAPVMFTRDGLNPYSANLAAKVARGLNVKNNPKKKRTA